MQKRDNRILFKAIVGMASEAVSVYIRQSKVFCKALIAIRRQQSFQDK